MIVHLQMRFTSSHTNVNKNQKPFIGYPNNRHHWEKKYTRNHEGVQGNKDEASVHNRHHWEKKYTRNHEGVQGNKDEASVHEVRLHPQSLLVYYWIMREKIYNAVAHKLLSPYLKSLHWETFSKYQCLLNIPDLNLSFDTNWDKCKNT